MQPAAGGRASKLLTGCSQAIGDKGGQRCAPNRRPLSACSPTLTVRLDFG